MLDIDTGKPVAGAYVYARSGYYKCGATELGGCGCVDTDVGLTKTDDKGRYHFDKPFRFGGSLLSDRFGVVVVYKARYTGVGDKYPSTSGTPDYLRSLYTQYFVGTGRYSDDYKNAPLTKDNSTYKVSSRRIKEFGNTWGATPRVFYLSAVLAGLGGPACISYKNKKVQSDVLKLRGVVKSAVYNEAKKLVKTDKDKQLLGLKSDRSGGS